MKSFTIGANEAGQRSDKYLKKLLGKAPGSFLYKMMRKKNIVLNGKKMTGSEKLCPGDEIKLFFSDDTFEKFSGEEETHYPKAKLDIVYEDEDILIIDKPAGMLSQKADASDVSANEYIIGYLLDTNQLSFEDLKTFKPSVCNRLDRNTSGLLIAGKTLNGLQKTAQQLKERSLKKYYICLVKGQITSKQAAEGSLIKDNDTNKVLINKMGSEKGQYIKTAYDPIALYEQETSGELYTLLRVHLITGRSHQIRAHLAFLNHPIVGDKKYGSKNTNALFAEIAGIHHQLLHAYELELEHGKIVTAPMNKSFKKALSCLKQLNFKRGK